MPPNQYCNRDILKAALAIPASSSAEHAQLDAVLDGVSRGIDEYCGFHFYPSSGVRYYRPRETTYLALDYPITNIDAVALDTNGDSSYESTLGATSYYTLPYNATEESPRRPWRALELRTQSNASAVFPIGVARGVRITGTWGYYNERDETTAHPATTIDATQTNIEFTGASSLHPGQTVRVDSEQIFIQRNGLSGSDTATTSGTVFVTRAVNGTVGSTHSSNSTMSLYTFPIIDRATLYQSQMDYRGQDAPLGTAGAEPFGTQRVTAPGGLHPFVKRQLDGFRTPRVG